MDVVVDPGDRDRGPRLPTRTGGAGRSTTQESVNPCSVADRGPSALRRADGNHRRLPATEGHGDDMTVEFLKRRDGAPPR